MPLQNPQDVAAHAALDTGVHAVGASTICRHDQTVVVGVVATFQLNPATGDLTDVANINDNSTASNAYATVIGKYAEIDLGRVCSVRRWRQFGDVANNGDGAWRLQFFNEADETWYNWVTGIASRATADWSSYTLQTPILTQKIRFTVVTVDSSGNSRCRELEVIY